MSKKRYRNYWFIAYPESCNEDWEEKLISYCIPAFVSPLHQPDPEGEAKGEGKPHWHVIFKYDGPQEPESVVNDIRDIFGQGACISPNIEYFRCKSLEGCVQYLIHRNLPEKQQFAGPSEIRCFSGADPEPYFLGGTDLDRILGEMQDWVIENEIYYYHSLSLYAQKAKPDWFKVLTRRCTMHMLAFCKSAANHEMHSNKDEIEIVTKLLELEKEEVKAIEVAAKEEPSST